jgi:hypothetical protein
MRTAISPRLATKTRVTLMNAPEKSPLAHSCPK